MLAKIWHKYIFLLLAQKWVMCGLVNAPKKHIKKLIGLILNLHQNFFFLYNLTEEFSLLFVTLETTVSRVLLLVLRFSLNILLLFHKRVKWAEISIQGNMKESQSQSRQVLVPRYVVWILGLHPDIHRLCGTSSK